MLTRARKDITPEQYDEFYQQVSYDQNAPLASTHNRVEGPTEHTQLLLISSKAPIDKFSREEAADPLELAKHLQGVSAVGHQHGVLPGLHILVGHQQFNLLVLDFLTQCQIGFGGPAAAQRQPTARRELSQPESLKVSSTALQLWSLRPSVLKPSGVNWRASRRLTHSAQRSLNR